MSFVQGIKGTAAAAAMGANTAFFGTGVLFASLGKLLTPAGPARDRVRRFLASLAEQWIAVNNWILGRYRSLRWDLQLPESVAPDSTYVINCNHQSWVDILVLQRAFNRRAPFMRFFIKQELLWVPILGYAWWALDFPFVKRYSREQIAARPSLRHADLETARKTCERISGIPVSIMNFLEGTRFSPVKRDARKSPYRHLLKPRVGGLGEVFYALNDQLRSLIDVTIVYPGGTPTFWDLLCGRVSEIVVRAQEVPIPDSLLGRNFRTDPQVRAELEKWAAHLWERKDRLIEAVLADRLHAA